MPLLQRGLQSNETVWRFVFQVADSSRSIPASFPVSDSLDEGESVSQEPLRPRKAYLSSRDRPKSETSLTHTQISTAFLQRSGDAGAGHGRRRTLTRRRLGRRRAYSRHKTLKHTTNGGVLVFACKRLLFLFFKERERERETCVLRALREKTRAERALESSSGPMSSARRRASTPPASDDSAAHLRFVGDHVTRVAFPS